MGRYTLAGETLTLRTVNEENEEALEEYSVTLENNTAVLVNQKDGLELVLHTAAGETAGTLIGDGIPARLPMELHSGM